MSEDAVSWTSMTTDEICMLDGPAENWRLMKFVQALYYALISQTTYLCFLIMVINHVVYASLMSLAFPLLVFLWGMLAIPRPTKKFWITVITYNMFVIIYKYVFKFEFIPFNDCNATAEMKSDPLCPARIFEIDRNGPSSAYDLLLLLALFFHRYALQVSADLTGISGGRQARRQAERQEVIQADRLHRWLNTGATMHEGIYVF